MADFLVDYDDFSGGMFVGPTSAKQPKNTFVGLDMLSVERDGMLMPCGPWVPRTGLGGQSYSNYMYITADGVQIYMADRLLTGLRSETVAGGSGPDVWDGAGSHTNTFTFGSFNGRFAEYNGSVYIAEGTGGPKIAATNIVTNAASEITTPAILNDLIMFGQFMVGAAVDRIYWSAPGDPTSWPPANFLVVTSISNAISSMTLNGSSLIIGTGGGFYQITGVLGSNESLVPIAAEGLYFPSFNPTGAETSADGLLLFGGRYFDGSAAVALRGSVIEPQAWFPTPVSTASERWTAQCGATIALVDGLVGGSMLVRSPTGKWFALSSTNAQATGGASSWVWGWANGTHRHRYLYASIGTARGNLIVARHRLGVSDPPTNVAATAFTSATAQLAEYRRTDRFRIKEVICELALGVTALNATRSIGLQMLTPQTPLEGGVAATTYSSAGSTLQTITLPALASSADQRVTVRFKPTDGTDSFSMIPKVTLTGVKLRRLLVRCSDVPERG